MPSCSIMASKGFLFLCLLIAIVGTPTVYGLKCYQCSSVVPAQDNCRDKTELAKYETNCPTISDQCLVSTFTKDGKSEVSRSCWSKAVKECSDIKATDLGSGYSDVLVSCCDKDVCNTGTTSHLSYTLLTFVFVFMLLLLKG